MTSTTTAAPESAASRKLAEVVPVTWRLPDRVDIVEFCERHRRLSARSSAVPGAYSLDRFPYWREVLRAFTDPAVRWLTIVAGSQTGKTTTCENFLFYAVTVDPTPALWVFASEDLRNEFVKERLLPAIDASPLWREHVPDAGRAVSLSMASFTTMPCFWALADSEASLSAKPVGLVIADETGKYPAKTTNEGSPIDQARARMRTFPRSKFVDTSTATTVDGGIWLSYLASDMREWMVPCPACGHRTPWERDHIRWEDRPAGVTALEWASRIDSFPDMAWWQCPACGHQVRGQLAKNLMNDAGVYVGRGFPIDHVGFRIPSLASQYTSFHGYAAALLRAYGAREMGDDEPLKHFTIHEDARPWEPRKIVIEDEAIARLARVDVVQGRVPSDARFLTCGVDVQDTGMFFGVWAWSVREGALHAHLVDHGFVGDFRAVETEALEKLFLDAGGKGRRVDMLFVDSGDGDWTADVYRWANRKSPRRVRPIKGASRAGGGRFWQASRGNDQSDHRGRLVSIFTDEVKDYLAAALAKGRVTLHGGVLEDPAFQAQMASEERREERRGGKRRTRWAKRAGRDANHHWDATVYAFAAAFFLGLARNDHRWRREMKPAAVASDHSAGVETDSVVSKHEPQAPTAAPATDPPAKAKAPARRMFPRRVAAGF